MRITGRSRGTWWRSASLQRSVGDRAQDASLMQIELGLREHDGAIVSFSTMCQLALQELLQEGLSLNNLMPRYS